MKITYLPRDTEVISTVANWEFSEWGHFNPSNTLLNRINTFAKQADSKSIPLTLVAYENDRPAGTASLVVSDMSIRPQYTPWMASVFVSPEHRGKGVGSGLCEGIIFELKRLNISTAYLYTPNKEAMYRRFGWKTIEHVEYRTQNVVIMKWKSSS